MSTRTKKLSSDSLTDKSDILSILESIDSMFEIYQNVFNSYTQDALMLAITTEAEMLLLKLNETVNAVCRRIGKDVFPESTQKSSHCPFRIIQYPLVNVIKDQ